MWSVSGLMEIHRSERALRHAAKQNIFFLIDFKKKLSHYFAFSIFLHKFAVVNCIRTLSADAVRRTQGVVLVAVSQSRSPQRVGRVAHEERLDCGEYIYDEGVYLTLCS